jgi:putative ABC transport system permease protein
VAFEHPLSAGWTSSFTFADRDPPPRGQEPEARVRPVWPGYFRTVGVPIVRGRDIAPTDRRGAPGVVVVNEAFVRRHFPEGDAIGKQLNRLAWWPNVPTSYEIVGVVADEPFMGRGQPGDPATYFPLAQFPLNDMYLVIRAAGDPLALAPAIRERVWRVDANLPVERIIGMRALLGDSVAEPRFNAALLGLFAIAALLLAAIGIYGVLSYTVAQRTNEIGVRMALGAERWSVIRLVVGEGIMIALLGIAIGLAGAFALSTVMDSVLYGTSSRNPLLFSAVAGFLATVALLAAYLPARRASRIEPVVALRYD